MRYQYVVILKKNSEEPVNLLSLLLCFLSTLIWLYNDSKTLFVKRIHDTRTYISFIVLVILCLGLAISLITWRRTHGRLRYRYFLLAVSLGWFILTSYVWIAGLFVLLAFLEHQTKRPLEIGFHHDRVVINNMMYKEHHTWKDFNNVILKDGLLTLDFANNRLFQKEVLMDDDEDNADEEEFNMFCRECLAAADRSITSR